MPSSSIQALLIATVAVLQAGTSFAASPPDPVARESSRRVVR